ncbi:MAG: Cardiolipin synthase [Thermoproteota archaeon]|nr:Cardiolipin synthase [Thermoproteota archaeon]
MQIPIWYVEMNEPERERHEDLVFGSSGRKWSERIYCAGCRKKIWVEQAINCELCGKRFCANCITDTGLIFKKKKCTSCLKL